MPLKREPQSGSGGQHPSGQRDFRVDQTLGYNVYQAEASAVKLRTVAAATNPHYHHGRRRENAQPTAAHNPQRRLNHASVR